MAEDVVADTGTDVPVRAVAPDPAGRSPRPAAALAALAASAGSRAGRSAHPGSSRCCAR